MPWILCVYLDESWNLGFGQGWFKYFTIALVVAKDSIHCTRCVRETKKHNIPRNVELKVNTTRGIIEEDLLGWFQNVGMEVHAIIVGKKNVEPELRKDLNILHNCMIGLLLIKRIVTEAAGTRVCANADRRLISVTSGLKFNGYLRYDARYEGLR